MARNAPLNKTEIAPRDRILLVAHELFYREGIRATGIDRIIAESRVTKVTFYRNFPSKNDLIREYLLYRHAIWMSWFTDALQRHRNEHDDVAAIVIATMSEWFAGGDFRGCAFINTVVEFDGALPDAMDIARSHKNDMAGVIENLLQDSPQRQNQANAIVLAVDGAIVHAQMDKTSANALQLLEILIRAVLNT